MFGKKKSAAGGKLSQKDIIANQVEQLGPGQSLSYRLPKSFGGELAVIELNPRYPEGKQKKYILWEQQIEDGKPAGKRRHFLDFDKPKELAGWVIDKGGELFSEPGSGSVVTQSEKA